MDRSVKVGLTALFGASLAFGVDALTHLDRIQPRRPAVVEEFIYLGSKLSTANEDHSSQRAIQDRYEELRSNPLVKDYLHGASFIRTRDLLGFAGELGLAAGGIAAGAVYLWATKKQ